MNMDDFTPVQRRAWDASTEYLIEKTDELFALAYAGYTKKSKGVLVIGFNEANSRGVPLMYVSQNDLRRIRRVLASSAVKSLEKYLGMYDPEYAACYCMLVCDGLHRTLMMQSKIPIKQIFAQNASRYLSQIENVDDWMRKWTR